jgi:hypothetical protein
VRPSASNTADIGTRQVSPKHKPRVTEVAQGRALEKLPLLGSNQDSPDPESGVLPVTPRGRSDFCADPKRSRGNPFDQPRTLSRRRSREDIPA